MKSRVLAAAAAALIVVGGCSSGSDAPEETAAPTTESGGKQVTEGSGEQAVFGDTYVYDSGLAVTVGEPAPVTPSATASGGEGAASFVRFEVTVVNNGRRDLDMSRFLTDVTSGNQEADEVFDSEMGLNGYPDDSLASESTVSFAIGYGVADPSSMVMEVDPDYESDLDPAVFTTS